MVTLNDLQNRISSYLKENYIIERVDSIPTVSNLSHGVKGKFIDLCVFSIDLRNSTIMLEELGREKAGRIHKSFLYGVSELVKANGGKIRNYTGDGLLAFWKADKSQISNAVFTAQQIKYLFTVEESPIKKLIDEFTELDFGIGIDCGRVFIFRAGIASSHNDESDLIFMGECVNSAVYLANKIGKPNYIQITENVYGNLKEDKIFSEKDGTRENKWKNRNIKDKNGNDITVKTTSWYYYV